MADVEVDAVDGRIDIDPEVKQIGSKPADNREVNDRLGVIA